MLGGNKAYNFLRNEKVICYPLPINLQGSSQEINIEYIEKYQEKFEETFELLEDDLSRQTIAAYLKLKVSENPAYNWEVYCPSPYFNELTESFSHGIFVDCGAYCGDTIERFVNWSHGDYQKILAIEADPDNFDRLKNFINDKDYKNIELLNCGVWSEKGSITFNKQIERTRASKEGNLIIPTDMLNNIIGEQSVDLIKIEIQGSELQALKGAISIMKNQIPCLTMMIFHKAEDLITIPQFIKEIQPKYKIYLRKHTRIRDNGLTLYAVP